MSIRKILSISILLICVGAGVSNAFAQGRYANVYSRMQVEGFVGQLENSSDAFYADFRREIDNSGLSSSARRTYNGYATQFENAVDRLRSRFNSNDSWWESRNEVRNMISSSQNINTVMNGAGFRRRLERQWNQLRNDINKLADAYDLPGLNGGGWSGGPWNPGYPGGGGSGGGGVPNWAIGTFYGTDPSTGSAVTLTIARSGSVSVSVNNGMPSYANLNGTTLVNGPYVSRISRINNGIRTTDVNDRSNFIDYRRTPGGGGGGVEPYPGQGQGDVPNWALGTFYGRNPQTGGSIRLDINSNGSVSISFDGAAPVYASINGTTMTNGQYVSRLSRIRNGIRTTDVNNGSYIDYFRR